MQSKIYPPDLNPFSLSVTLTVQSHSFNSLHYMTCYTAVQAHGMHETWHSSGAAEGSLASHKRATVNTRINPLLLCIILPKSLAD